jgi:predicted phosphodiesterase
MIGILSDAHGNQDVFRRTLSALSDLGADRFIFLGDAVGYIPSVDVVSDLMGMGSRVNCVLGNHEQMLLTGAYPERLEPVYQMSAIRGLLSPQQYAFIASWSTHLELNLSCGRSLFVHGSPADTQNGYVYPDSDLTQFNSRHDFVFMGHTHRAFIRREGACTYVNVGSCGLPRDDGRYASAVLFDPVSGRLRLIRPELSFFDPASFFAGRGVHPSVVDLFNRRLPQIPGDIIESR